jgi:hypothetical protein
MADIEPLGDGRRDLPATAGRGALRVSHADRDEVTELLRVAAGDGRLTPEELDERLERALTAKTYDDLAMLTADLPPAPGSAGSALAATPEPKDLMRINVGSGGARRTGHWVVPRELDVRIRSGGVRLDFTQAVITQPVLRITAEVRSGGLTLITKPGIVVDADDVSVRSGSVRVRAPWDDDTPALLRIEVSGAVRSGGITARPLRRSLWQWLRGAPRRWENAG